jgi:mRNA-degrading endonuclease toxin of MazEF toxin-antitoxin module
MEFVELGGGIAEVNLGDIYWIVPPTAQGHVQQGRRPGIIWQDRSLFPNLPTSLVIPLTSKQSALRFGGCHLLTPTAQNGLATPSVAMVFQLAAIDLRDIGSKIGAVDDADRAILQDLTRQVCGLP